MSSDLKALFSAFQEADAKSVVALFKGGLVVTPEDFFTKAEFDEVLKQLQPEGFQIFKIVKKIADVSAVRVEFNKEIVKILIVAVTRGNNVAKMIKRMEAQAGLNFEAVCNAWGIRLGGNAKLKSDELTPTRVASVLPFLAFKIKLWIAEPDFFPQAVDAIGGTVEGKAWLLLSPSLIATVPYSDKSTMTADNKAELLKNIVAVNIMFAIGANTIMTSMGDRSRRDPSQIERSTFSSLKAAWRAKRIYPSKDCDAFWAWVIGSPQIEFTRVSVECPTHLERVVSNFVIELLSFVPTMDERAVPATNKGPGSGHGRGGGQATTAPGSVPADAQMNDQP